MSRAPVTFLRVSARFLSAEEMIPKLYSDEHNTWLRGWHGPLEDHFLFTKQGVVRFHVSESETVKTRRR